jgi:hypothetical protein
MYGSYSSLFNSGKFQVFHDLGQIEQISFRKSLLTAEAGWLDHI